MDGQGQEAGDGQEAAVTAVGEWARAWCRAMPEAARQEYIDRALHSLLPGVPVGEYRPGRRFAFGPDKTAWAARSSSSYDGECEHRRPGRGTDWRGTWGGRQ